MDVFSRKVDEAVIKKKAIAAFKEDLGSGDATTDAVVSGKNQATALITSNEDGVIAGGLEAKAILEDGGLKVEQLIKDGAKARKGQKVMKVSGDAREILARERTALNYIQKMSGIATLSSRMAKMGNVAFLRKQDPGLGMSENRAVQLGGCLTHRLGLYDGIIIKDNHLKLLGGGLDAIREAIARADKHRGKNFLLEVEVESVQGGRAAAEAFKELSGPRAILLDNMSPAQVKKAVFEIKKISKDVFIEASGNITEKNAKDYLKAGVDFVSTSYLVKAAGFLDLTLEF